MSGRGKKRTSPAKTMEKEMSPGKSKAKKEKLEHEEEEMKMQLEEKEEFGGSSLHSLLQLFLTTPLDDHIPRGLRSEVYELEVNNVLCVRETDSLPMVLRRLSSEGFLGAPVVDENNKFLGFIDMLQLTASTAALFYGENEKAWVDWWDKEEMFANTLVCEIMDYNGVSIHKDFTSFAGLEYLARRSAHRVCCVDDDNKVTGIFTSSMVISWIRKHKGLLDKLRNTLVSDVTEKLTSDLVCIEETKTALQAFTLMTECNVSGLAVVNENGFLTSHISNRDIRGYGSSGEKFWRLFEPIKTFRAMERDEFPRLAPATHYTNKKVPKKPIYVLPTDNLETVLDFMNDGNIHRVFVCKENPDVGGPVPTHVISQTDVCRVLMDYCIELSSQ